MPHRILIVDDDKEFSNLLKDVFEQADYTVVNCSSVDEAKKKLLAEDVDLVVTDYRMPGKTGLDLIDQLSAVAPEIPVVMVSGYLENGVIRDLISRGVGGIFMKPLNIFSLLKKAAELIARSQQSKERTTTFGPEAAERGEILPFDFETFPCRDIHARDFARRLYDLRDFSKNLLLIANAGAPMRKLAQDLAGMSERKDVVIYLTPSRVSREHLFDELETAIEAGVELITFVFTDTATLKAEQCDLIYQLARQKGPFVALTIPKRFIFFLRRELNDYYDSGLIDEEFYIFLGSTEVRVPELSEIPEDVPFLADALLAEVAPGKTFEPAARAALARRDWPGHAIELKKAVESAALWAEGTVVRVEDVQAVFAGGDDRLLPPSPLTEYLNNRKSDYLKALAMIAPFVDGLPASTEGDT